MRTLLFSVENTLHRCALNTFAYFNLRERERERKRCLSASVESLSLRSDQMRLTSINKSMCRDKEDMNRINSKKGWIGSKCFWVVGVDKIQEPTNKAGM